MIALFSWFCVASHLLSLSGADAWSWTQTQAGALHRRAPVPTHDHHGDQLVRHGHQAAWLPRRQLAVDTRIFATNKRRWPQSNPSPKRRRQQRPSTSSDATFQDHPVVTSSTDDADSHDYTSTVLKKYGYSNRLITVISPRDLPILAEVYSVGKSEVVSIVDIQFSKSKDPLFVIQARSDERQSARKAKRQTTVDAGQITTLWWNGANTAFPATSNDKNNGNEPDATKLQKYYDELPVGHVEESLDSMYKSLVGKSRSASASLTKKQIVKLASQAPENSVRTELILRQVIKSGDGFARLVDSSVVTSFLYPQSDASNSPSDHQSVMRRFLCADALAKDAKQGGRFKRMPSMLVHHDHTSYGVDERPKNDPDLHYDDDDDEDDEEGEGIVTIVNGGWLVQDQSVRANQEAQKFTERKSATPSTAADQRIIQRLECLAMGQAVSLNDKQSIELDVRTTLSNMDLPLTSDGARSALIDIGRWQAGDDRNDVNPWSVDTLDAARWYQDYDTQRRQDMVEAIRSKNQQQKKQKQTQKKPPPKLTLQQEQQLRRRLEGRSDLTRWPSVCVDAERTSFRDDAIGLRPRAKTGRKVVGSNKWELLLHIADVSDIYCTKSFLRSEVAESEGYLQTLQGAAESRGSSRYDLPLGPLHLMPPTVLRSLAFQTFSADPSQQSKQTDATTNRCVTLWVYLEEETGKALDAGVERSIISRPLALSFQTATSLLDGSLEPENEILSRGQSLLSIADKLLQSWKDDRLKTSKDAQSRDDRLTARENVSKQMRSSNRRDDGKDGFQRTRGHLLVNNALELYSHGTTSLLRRRKIAMPRVAGTEQGRAATAPLRRYIDGMMQRQVLSGLCGYGGAVLTRDECVEVGKKATETLNAMNNVQSVKGNARGITKQQREAIRTLRTQMTGRSGPIPASGTGRQGEVVIDGVGAIASCRGLQEPLRAGEQIMVKIRKIDEELGTVSVIYHDS